ncbi:efflux RND transporter periplasmic adaptor subunit [Psychrobacter urativorans]|uniref:efflux RND transporter periplasmic adaptor subunit n=1 Tax=Psychrobacter urativorans TaxID=45610 RepID=UPI000A023B85|nr:efflux RND transporter periplasmic adaptor subunit [Psychrobacter urativorans]
MSDFQDPNIQKNPKAQQDSNPERTHGTELPPENELPPYRQPDASINKSSSKYPLWLIPVIVAVLVVGVLLGKYWGSKDAAVTDAPLAVNGVSSTQNKDASATADTPEQTVLSVETIQPSQDNIGNTLSADGTISAKDIATVSGKVNGVAIERILVEAGQSVKAGQVLAVFDTAALQQQVLQAQADVSEAEATLANARTDAARVLPLLDIDAISKQEADRYRTNKLQAEASLDAAKARLNTQRLNLSNANVVAPVSGVISEKLADVGMVAGSDPLFTIIKDGILEWQASIDPKLIGEVKVGTPVKVSLPKNQSVMGEVSRIAPTADNNRQITIYASLVANSAARAGMYQSGEFQLGSASKQVVPNSAIVSNDGYDYVMLVTDIKTENDTTKNDNTNNAKTQTAKNENAKNIGRIKQLRVTLGDRVGDNVTIKEPIPVDSKVVKQGGSFLNDGDLVRVVDSPATQARP